MEFSELKAFVDAESERLKNKFPCPDKEKGALARVVKLMEEIGELSNAVLIENSMQRKEKLDKKDKDNLSEEIADVILCTLILAKHMNVDIELALEKKIEKIKKRVY